MIVGHGAIARVLCDRDDRLYFASGVANSQETREKEFDRERELLLSQSRHRHLVYFSTLSVFYADTPYTRHKRRMENIVKCEFPCWTIMRLGNIEWGTNPSQLVPFIRTSLKDRRPMTLHNDYRHLVTKSEFLYWVEQIPSWNCEMNVTGRLMKPAEIVSYIQELGYRG